MRLTCDAANKLIKQLNADRDAMLTRERSSYTYSYIYGETPFIPAYDFAKTQAALEKNAENIVKLRHAVNVANSTVTSNLTGMTIDEMLVRMPIVNAKKAKLDTMRQMAPKNRTPSFGSGKGVSEYVETNFRQSEADDAYRETVAELTTLQSELNRLNMETEFEVDIEL